MFDRYESEMPIEFKTGIISVIVPIYNVEKYILKCLKSISEQTYKSLEVILVNDGSTDNSGSIAETFAKNDERFIYILKKMVAFLQRGMKD